MSIKPVIGCLCVWLLSGPVPVRGEDMITPHYPYRVAGACPYEYCYMGTWTAIEDIPVYRMDRDASAPIFTIKAGQDFVAIEGAYWTLTPLIVRPRHPVRLNTDGDFVILSQDRARVGNSGHGVGTIDIPAGMDIHIVANIGEGAYVGIVGGRAVQADGEWFAPPVGPDRSNSIYTVVTPAQVDCKWVRPAEDCARHGYFTANLTEWWVKVTLDGQTGWMRADPEDYESHNEHG